MNNPLTTISPLDGRYADKVAELRQLASEFALIKFRLIAEVEWFITLCETFRLEGTRRLKKTEIQLLRNLCKNFDAKEAKRIKEFEKKTNHDVKAVEYYLKEKTGHTELKKLHGFIHFGCTSEDLNSMAYAIMMKRTLHEAYLPLLGQVIENLKEKAKKHKALAMLSHTHGQPATPTTLGKEFAVFAKRLRSQSDRLGQFKMSVKWSGAVGNFAAHHAAYPKFDWVGRVTKAMTSDCITPNMLTTQIEPHDYMADIFDHMRHVNNIMIGLARDIWMYVSYEYLSQKKKQGEVGSSTMPHKVNPIDFENAEGNCEIANGLLTALSNKLPISRMQRDLSDSTAQRNIGGAVGYCILAMKSLAKGLKKIEPNEKKLSEDLDNHWEVLTEAVQTVMRKHGIENAYEKLKEISRGKKITREALHAFIGKLDIPKSDKNRLLELTPATYTGLSKQLVESIKLG